MRESAFVRALAPADRSGEPLEPSFVLRAGDGRHLFVSAAPEAGLRCVYGRFTLPSPVEVWLEPSRDLLLTYYLAGEIQGEVADPACRRPLPVRLRHSLLRTPNRTGGFIVRLPAGPASFFQLRIAPEVFAAWCRDLWPEADPEWLRAALLDQSGTTLLDAPWGERESRLLPPAGGRDLPIRGLAPMLAGRGCELLAAFLKRLRERTERPGRWRAAVRHLHELDPAQADLPHRLPELRERIGGLGRTALHGAVRNRTGTSPGRHLRRLRLERARQLLRSTDLSVLDIASEVGWQCPSKFARAYRAAFGRPPSAERRSLRDDARGGGRKA